MDLGLAGRVYVVTGGSRGLGRASAEALVAEGAHVVVSARGADDVTAAVDSLGAERAEGVVGDVADPALAELLVGAALGRFGRLDGALVSVGGPPPGTAMTLTDDDWRAAFESVFLGSLRVVRTVAARLDSGGAIGWVLSTSVRSPIAGLAASNGLRPGLGVLVKDLADELGPRGIRVVGLMPGRIATDRLHQLDALSGDADAARAANEAHIPLRRYGAPAEFGAVAAFLLSPAASYLTGCVIPVEGGALRVP